MPLPALPAPRRGAGRSGPLTIGFLNAARVMWGAEQSLFALATTLRDLGHRPVLVAWRGEIASQWRLRDIGAVVELPGADRRDPNADLALLARHRRELPAFDAVVAFTYTMAPALALLRLDPRQRGAALALDLHDQLEGTKGRAILQASALGATTVIAVSAFTAAQVRHPRTHALHRPVLAPNAGTPGPRPDGTPLRVGLVGRVDPSKKHLLAIEALGRMTRPGRLLVRGGSAFGTDQYLVALQAAVAASGVDVEFQGTVPAAEALAGLDVLVVTNDREPMGRTVAEAQLSGVPVVVPDAGGAGELVEDGVTGLTFRAGDPGSLAAALDRLAADPGLATRLAATAAGIARVRHDPVRYAHAYLDALLPLRGADPSPSLHRSTP